MPRYFDLRSTVMIVVGHGILPEEEDRPIAYELQREVRERAPGRDAGSVVVTDVWLMNHELGAFFPAIALGGPGVNAFTSQIYEELPVAASVDHRVFVQLAEDVKRAALWGMDEGGTREAVALFVKDGLLDRFLQLVWRRP